ncbi:MAG: hypothetical protein WCA77_04815, partial [Thermoplasmata archaeon]
MGFTAWTVAGVFSEPAAAPTSVGFPGLHTDSSTIDVTPAIAQIVNFTITGNTSGDSGPFAVASADTLVVFVELFGRTTAHNVSVEDGPNDTFVQEAEELQYANGGTDGFSVWACADIDGGPSVDVNVTLTGGTTDSASVEIVDVNGGNIYGGNPIPFVDQVGDTVKGVNRHANDTIDVDPNDLVLAGFGTWSWNNITPLSPAQLGDQVTTNSSVAATNVTAAVMYFTNNNSTSKNLWMNGTWTHSAPWIENIITLGAVDYTTDYSVSFSESGLPSGLTWCQDIQDGSSTQCESTPSGSSWQVTNGTYTWNVSIESNDNFLASPGYTGMLTVAGGDVSVPISFNETDDPHMIQHVIIIMLENEPLSSVQKSGPYESYLATHYEALSTFYAPCHPSAPEYQALIAAETNSCSSSGTTGDAYPDSYGALGSWENATLADLLQNATNDGTAKNFTWADFAENLPSNACTDPAEYDHGGAGGSDDEKKG